MNFKAQNPLLLVLLAILALLLVGCELFIQRESPTLPFSQGHQLIQAGGYLYVLGGTDSEGNVQSSVWYRKQGSSDRWKKAQDLPEPLTDFAIVKVRGFFVIIGGRGPEGPSEELYYAPFNTDDGSVGFRNGIEGNYQFHWERGRRPLPEARVGATALRIGRQILLMGGETVEGVQDSILMAQIWLDGQIGPWSPTEHRLPTSSFSPGALHIDGTIVLSLSGSPSGVYRASWTPPIALGVWESLSAPFTPGPSSEIFHTGERFVLTLGQEEEDHFHSEVYLTEDLLSWEEVPMEGPLTQGTYTPGLVSFSTPGSRASEGERFLTLPLEENSHLPPLVHPPGGVIKGGTRLGIKTQEGLSVRYSLSTDGLEPEDPVESSPTYDPLNPLSLSQNTRIKFQSYGEEFLPSPVIEYNYTVRSGSSFILLETGPPFQGTFTQLEERFLEDSFIRHPYSPSQAGTLEIHWQDSSTNPNFTQNVMITLTEGDYYTPVITRSGQIFHRLQDPEGPIQVNLQNADYFLLIETVDGSEGGSFGMALVMP